MTNDVAENFIVLLGANPRKLSEAYYDYRRRAKGILKEEPKDSNAHRKHKQNIAYLGNFKYEGEDSPEEQSRSFRKKMREIIERRVEESFKNNTRELVFLKDGLPYYDRKDHKILMESGPRNVAVIEGIVGYTLFRVSAQDGYVESLEGPFFHEVGCSGRSDEFYGTLERRTFRYNTKTDILETLGPGYVWDSVRREAEFGPRNVWKQAL